MTYLSEFYRNCLEWRRRIECGEEDGLFGRKGGYFPGKMKIFRKFSDYVFLFYFFTP